MTLPSSSAAAGALSGANSASSAAGLASDTRATAALRSKAARDPKAAVHETAKQFEALFMQEILKSMRASTQSSGMLDNSGTQLGTEMLDTQYATKMTGLPGGLADVIARQLERQMGIPGSAAIAPSSGKDGKGATGPTLPAVTGPLAPKVPTKQAAFLRDNEGAAQAAQAASGIPAEFMLAQAAHESGWGQRPIRNADGSSSHNVFGLKAGAGWSGPVAEVKTTEYVDGVPRTVTARFRSYDSPQAALMDYARLLSSNPRYAAVYGQVTRDAAATGAAGGKTVTAALTDGERARHAQAFAQGLQRAGYATDPAYAAKLARTINTTLRLQRAGAASA